MQVDLTPEIARIAQKRADQLGIKLEDELARVAFEEYVFNLDPDHNFMVDQLMALNSIDVLACSIGANDVVVNDHRIDIRAVNDLNEIHIPRVLLNSPVLNSGTFAVKVEDAKTAKVIAYFPVGKIISSTNYNEDKSATIMKVPSSEAPDTEAILLDILSRVSSPLDGVVNVLPNAQELKNFVSNRHEITVPRQKQIVMAICAHEEIRNLLRTFKCDLANGVVSKLLRSESLWNKRTDELTIELAPKFSTLSRGEIKKTLQDIGETYGGQPQAPNFKKAIRKKLTLEHLARTVGKEKLARIKSVVDKVLDGASLVEAVKDKIKNSVAVDIAVAIKANRKEMNTFVAASAEEIGLAFQKLAVQPAYATHSSSSDNGVDSINEALEILTTCEGLDALDA